jgi:hypothetical protein
MKLIPTSTILAYRITTTAQVLPVVLMEAESFHTESRIECDDLSCPCHEGIVSTWPGNTIEGIPPSDSAVSTR